MCVYDGELASDGLSPEGNYECNHVGGRYKWMARIRDNPQPASRNDWRGQVWQSFEGGNDWRGIRQRRG